MATKIAVVASQDPETPEEGICPVLPVRDMVLFPGIIIPLFELVSVVQLVHVI